jgi:peptidyl-dipeptidase A
MPVHLTRGSGRLRARSNRVGIGDGEGNGLCEFIFGGVLTHLIGLRGQYALHDLSVSVQLPIREVIMHGLVSCRLVTSAAVLLVMAALTGCDVHRRPSVGEGTAFVDRAEEEALEAWIAAERAAWVRANFITMDTTLIASAAEAEKIGVESRLAREAVRYSDVDLSDDHARKLLILRTMTNLPAPEDRVKTAELARITTSLKSAYGSGKYCPGDRDCLELEEMENILIESRDPDELLDVWQGWRTVSVPMRKDFERYVEIANEGARELGFADLGALWRSKYDMEPDEFAADVDRIWQQVKPLYDQLHCYVRARLAARYGEQVVPLDEPIPAHLLGNMWAQDWQHIADLALPGDADPGYDLTALLRERGIDAVEMVRIGERFFSSLGFDELPATFWERSLFVKPRDRDVVCHASAWDIDWVEDLRLKMCIEIESEDFITVHHELGHNYYQRAYGHLDPLFRDSANDGFHEALGDTLALSITPSYLVRLGFLDSAPDGDVVAMQLKTALDKIAFLPFGLLVDRYRWQVFAGEITPDEYNTAWWELRERYQGVRPPVPRGEQFFDPGAKYHIANNTPYTRYFLAAVLHYQFHRALCEAIGFEGPLHECSIYGNPVAGERLQQMMEMGRSRPWQDALEALTGQREVDATAIVDYYQPLMDWLEEQNAGRSCGW